MQNDNSDSNFSNSSFKKISNDLNCYYINLNNLPTILQNKPVTSNFYNISTPTENFKLNDENLVIKKVLSSQNTFAASFLEKDEKCNMVSEKQKKNVDISKRLIEKRRLDDSLKQKVAELMKENMLLKNCLNTKNNENNIHLKNSNEVSSVIVSGQTYLQKLTQEKVEVQKLNINSTEKNDFNCNNYDLSDKNSFVCSNSNGCSNKQENEYSPSIATPLSINCNTTELNLNLNLLKKKKFDCELKETNQQNYQTTLMAAAATLFSNYQTYCQPQHLNLNLNQVHNSSNIFNYMNEKNLHLSAFQPLNQFHYQPTTQNLNLINSSFLPSNSNATSQLLNQVSINNILPNSWSNLNSSFNSIIYLPLSLTNQSKTTETIPKNCNVSHENSISSTSTIKFAKDLQKEAIKSSLPPNSLTPFINAQIPGTSSINILNKNEKSLESNLKMENICQNKFFNNSLSSTIIKSTSNVLFDKEKANCKPVTLTIQSTNSKQRDIFKNFKNSPNSDLNLMHKEKDLKLNLIDEVSRKTVLTNLNRNPTPKNSKSISPILEEFYLNKNLSEQKSFTTNQNSNIDNTKTTNNQLQENENSTLNSLSLLESLLTTTRQSPSVPESRTEQQSGLSGNKYSSIISTNQKKNEKTHLTDYVKSPSAHSTLKNKMNYDVNNFKFTSSNTNQLSSCSISSSTSSAHYSITNSAKSDSEQSLVSPHSIDSSTESVKKLKLLKSSEMELLKINNETEKNVRRNSFLSNISIGSDDSLGSQQQDLVSPNCSNDFSIKLKEKLVTSTCKPHSITKNLQKKENRVRPDLERYMDRRRRNNEAAKRCRANRRAIFEFRSQRAQQLEIENNELRQELIKLYKELEQLKNTIKSNNNNANIIDNNNSIPLLSNSTM